MLSGAHSARIIIRLPLALYVGFLPTMMGQLSPTISRTRKEHLADT
jgi:hypothetical protein